jgi:hypothetical protein
MLALVCGLGVAVVGYLTTTARARATAAAILTEPASGIATTTGTAASGATTGTATAATDV